LLRLEWKGATSGADWPLDIGENPRPAPLVKDTTEVGRHFFFKVGRILTGPATLFDAVAQLGYQLVDLVRLVHEVDGSKQGP
jgi:hypothetical protein